MRDRSTSGPKTAVFVVATFAYLIIIAVGAERLGFFDPAGTPIGPNEWGDTLAGVFSPLAFLWLIYASLSQRAELELQRQELRENNATQAAQREEMAKQVEALSAQASLLEAQANATYEPVLVVVSSMFDEGQHGATLVQLRNLGGNLNSVIFSGNATPTEIHFASTARADVIRGNVIPYWPNGAIVKLTIDHPGLGEDGPAFRMKFERIDGAERERAYVLLNKATRIQRLPNQ